MHPSSTMIRTLSWMSHQEDAARKVTENTPEGEAIGDPVVATDGDDDILTYTLGDNGKTMMTGSFDIDWATGQLRTKGKLNFETTPDLHGRHRKGYGPGRHARKRKALTSRTPTPLW